MTNRPLQLKALGQRVWYDTIDRVQLLSRLFEYLIDEDGITGSTANLTIFEHSISHSHVCKEQMNPLISEGKSILAARATAHRQLCKTGQPRALRQRLRISFDGVPGPGERLQPVERVIFLLCEVFDDDYPQIAKWSERRLHLWAVPMATPACHEAAVTLLFTAILPLGVG
jgi:hypothetical protein